MNLLARIFGYMTAAEAKKHGCTHEGSFLGIPVWYGNLDKEGPLVIGKFDLLDRLIPYWQALFCAMVPMGVYPLKVKREI